MRDGLVSIRNKDWISKIHSFLIHSLERSLFRVSQHDRESEWKVRPYRKKKLAKKKGGGNRVASLYQKSLF